MNARGVRGVRHVHSHEAGHAILSALPCDVDLALCVDGSAGFERALRSRFGRAIREARRWRFDKALHTVQAMADELNAQAGS